MESREAVKGIVKLLLMLCLTFSLMQVVQADVKADTVTVTVERFVLGKGFIIEPTVMETEPGDSYADLLQRVLAQNGLSCTYSDHPEYGFYLVGIKDVDVGIAVPDCVQRVLDDNNMIVGDNKKTPDLEEFSYTTGSGWMYYVNNEYVDLGMGRAYPEDNDVIRYMFTLCFGSDLTGIGSAELTGGETVEYYKTADKSALIRVMGRVNEDRERWESAGGFAEAYDFAIEVMETIDSSQHEVNEATEWLAEIENDLPQDATDITMNNSQITLNMDDKTQQLTYTLTPSNVVTEVTWRSDNTGIAKVDSQGIVTAMAVGETDIHAVTENGYETSCHVTITASLKNEFLAGTPNVSAKAAAYNSVTVSWSAYKNATKYVVCRRKPGSAAWDTLSEVTGTSYTDKTAEPGINYYYTVKAASDKWGEIVYSKFRTDLAVKTTMGKTTLSTAAASAYNKVKITWKTVSGASGYQVYRATSKSGTYSYIKEVSKGSTVSYTDSGLTSGKTYYYKVRAYRTVDGSNEYGAYSDIKSAKPVPSKTTLSKAAGSAYNKVKVTWKKVTGASGYRVYRATSKNGTYKYIKDLSKGSTVSYTDSKGLTAGKTYYYKVRAYRTVSKTKVYGAYSGIKSAKPVPAKAKISKLSTAKNKATVKWSKVSGASGYEVYYATSKNGKYKRAKLITKGATVSFTHSNLKKGKTYYYKVRAYRTVNGKRVYGAFSAVKGKKIN